MFRLVNRGPTAELPRRIASISVLAVSFFLLVPLSDAQCRDPDFPDASGPVAAPTRPTESFPSDPLQTGVVQLESGWTQTWISSESFQSAVPTMFRFGAWCNL